MNFSPPFPIFPPSHNVRLTFHCQWLGPKTSFGTCTRCFGAKAEQKRKNGQPGLSSFSMAWPGSFLLGMSCHRETLAVVSEGEKTGPWHPSVSRRLLHYSVGWTPVNVWQGHIGKRIPQELCATSPDCIKCGEQKATHLPRAVLSTEWFGDSKCNSSGDKQRQEKADWIVNSAEAGPKNVKSL